MKAIQVLEKGSIELIDIEEPKIKNENEVKVKVKAFGICGSDVGIYKGLNPFVVYPRIIGHEVSGQVVEKGLKVKDLQIGDKVILEPIEYCGECYACKNDMSNVCKSLEVYGVHIDGGFCEYMVTNSKKWHKVDDSLSYVQASIAEPFTIAEQSTSRADLREDDWAFISGAGPAGLLTVNIAKEKGAKVILAEINETRRNLAKEFGADYTFNPLEEDIKERIESLTDGELVNVFIDTTGVKDVIKEGIENLSPAGRFVPLAFGSDDINISYKLLNQKQITVAGTRLQFDKFDKVCEYLHKKKDLIDKFITNILPAEEYERAFDIVINQKNEAVKVVLTFDN